MKPSIQILINRHKHMVQSKGKDIRLSDKEVSDLISDIIDMYDNINEKDKIIIDTQKRLIQELEAKEENNTSDEIIVSGGRF